MIDDQRVVALLPMKFNSARVPMKNFREIAGKPLFRWILDSLLETNEIDQVVINTDARDIITEAGLRDGDHDGRVLIRNRKPELCGDMVSMNLVLGDDVAAVPSDIYAMTHTTNPLLQTGTIAAILRAYTESDHDSLFTVNRHQARFYTPDGYPINHDPANLMRTQDLSPYFEENSVFYLFTADSFASTGARIGKTPLLYETPLLESVDIDEPSEWFLAEALLKRVATGEALPQDASGFEL